jgi:diguanylate cyclase (GGDEF)-like protein
LNGNEALQRKKDYPITFISLDLDCLKIINDDQGHEMGDKILINLATVLKFIAQSDIVARIGG